MRMIFDVLSIECCCAIVNSIRLLQWFEKFKFSSEKMGYYAFVLHLYNNFTDIINENVCVFLHSVCHYSIYYF